MKQVRRHWKAILIPLTLVFSVPLLALFDYLLFGYNNFLTYVGICCFEATAFLGGYLVGYGVKWLEW